MDIEVVLDGQRVVGASTRKQGAELIRANEARRLAVAQTPTTKPTGELVRLRNELERAAYHRMTIVNTELQDLDD